MSLLHNDNIATVRWRSNRCPPTAFKRCVFYSTSLSAFAFLCGKAGILLSLTSGSTLLLKKCVRLFTCKQASAATKLVPRWVTLLSSCFFAQQICVFILTLCPPLLFFFLPLLHIVLGGYLRRAWHRPNRYLPWRLWPPVGENQRLLQRGHWR